MAKKKQPVATKEESIVPKNKGGRPKAVLDEAKIEEMAQQDCTIEEIAAEMRVHHDTLYARYSECLKKGRLRGNKSLKRVLFEKALAGDMTALIWLSKNRLGYRDRQPDEVTQVNFLIQVNEVPK